MAMDGPRAGDAPVVLEPSHGMPLTLLGRLTAATHHQDMGRGVREEWAAAMSKVYLLSEVLGMDPDSELVRRASDGLTWMS